MVAYVATLERPRSMDLAIPEAKSGPCSLTEMSIVEDNIAGKTEKIPLMTLPKLDRKTAIAMTMPASTPRNIIFLAV